MIRKKLRFDELEVDSFVTDAETVLAEKQEREGGVRAYGSFQGCTNAPPCEFSEFYGYTAGCDTDHDCSGVCLVRTNICGPCE